MCRIRLYDTLSRGEKALEPVAGDAFGMYCCGPTVYGPAHIGNFRTFVLQDVLRRSLETSGLTVRHVRNITDIDDKTIRQARETGKPLAEVTRHWTDKFHADARALNMLAPSEEPRATDFIAPRAGHKSMIGMIQELIDHGHAYVEADGSVYFRVRSYADYGKLSHFHLEDLATQEQNSGGAANAADEYDRESVADFVLWKAYKPEDGDNYWDAPWGRGRPGWHIECSVMSIEYLGETFDLHGGGVDLCFPHHENEIAQSECTTGKPFARHWMHSEHLLVDGAKMSKSLGNLYTLADLEAKGYTPMEVRYLLISGHYRKQLNFTLKGLDDARHALRRLRRAAAQLAKAAGIAIADLPSLAQPPAPADLGAFDGAWRALCDDLNTPAALGHIFSALRDLTTSGSAACASDAQTQLRGLACVLYALGLERAMEAAAEAPAAEAPAEVRALAEERWAARTARDWAKADELRARLAELGWTVKDRKDGYDLTAG